MGLFDKFFNKKESQSVAKTKPPIAEIKPKVKKSRKPVEKKKEPTLSEKEKATAAGEPYVNIVRMEVDPNDINSGSVELDFNDKFVLNLIRAGYKMKETDTDNDIVDRWWTNLCRATVLETFEQEMADPEKRVNSDLRNVRTKDLGNGRTEIS
jgi:hypothetical protein